jgi:hypothetical protein
MMNAPITGGWQLALLRQAHPAWTITVRDGLCTATRNVPPTPVEQAAGVEPVIADCDPVTLAIMLSRQDTIARYLPSPN